MKYFLFSLAVTATMLVSCSRTTMIAVEMPTAKLAMSYPESWVYDPNLNYIGSGELELVAALAYFGESSVPLAQFQVLQGAMFFETPEAMASAYMDFLREQSPDLTYDLEPFELSGADAAAASYRYETSSGEIEGRDVFIVRPAGWCVHVTYKAPAVVADETRGDVERMISSVRLNGDMSGMHPPLWFIGRGIDLLNSRLPAAAVNAVTTGLSVDSTITVGWYHLGRATLALGDTTTGVRHVQRALDAAPGLHDARLLLGDVALLSGDTTSAEIRYRETVRLAPKYAPAWTRLGVVEYARERYDSSLRYLEKAREYNPTLPDVYWHLAGTYEALGRIDDAINASLEYLARDDRSPRADDVRALYATLVARVAQRPSTQP
jgi:tetratricopeptide (TPR) repeat protein